MSKQLGDDPVYGAMQYMALAAVDRDNRERWMNQAFDLITDDNSFQFAIGMTCATAEFVKQHMPDGDEPVTMEVEQSGRIVPVDDLEEPTRTAWRAILAAANGDSPVPFLTTPPTPTAQAELLSVIVQVFNVMAREASERAA